MVREESKESKDSKDNGERKESQGTPDRSRSRQRAVKILGSRQLSSREMGKRLSRKGEAEDTVQDTVRWLEDIGALNDVDYAEGIVRHYSTKGYGKARIRDEFYKRGIPRELWEDAMAGIEDAASSGATFQYLDRRLRGSSEKEDLRRAINSLCNRGFSFEEARMEVSSYLESIANTEERDDAER